MGKVKRAAAASWVPLVMWAVGLGFGCAAEDRGAVRDGAVRDGGQDGRLGDGGASPDARALDAISNPGLCGFDRQLPFEESGSIWQLESADGKTCIGLTRRDDSQPGMIYKAIPYTLLTVRIGSAAGKTEAISDPSRLAWASTHHNWNDTARAQGAQDDYELAVRFEPMQQGLTYTLSARHSGAQLWQTAVLPVNAVKGK